MNLYAPRPHPQRGAVPVWVPLAILFAGLILGMRALHKDARGRGLAQVDLTRYRLAAESQWLSQAWVDELEHVLVELRTLPIDDPAALDSFAQKVAALPFVAEVGTYSVQWPDGLILPLKLHEPIACIKTGGRDYLPIAPDGTVLGGYTDAPHQAYGGWLPTLGPHGLIEERQGSIQPGDRIEVPELLAALSVAQSMWGFLDVRDLRRLDRVVIDASATDAPVLDRASSRILPARLPGGVKIDLEGGRRIYFGRPPVPVHDGELPVGYKWDHVREALFSLEAMAGGVDEDHGLVGGIRRDWALLDVRFDTPVALSAAEVRAIAERSQAPEDPSESDR